MGRCNIAIVEIRVSSNYIGGRRLYGRKGIFDFHFEKKEFFIFILQKRNEICKVQSDDVTLIVFWAARAHVSKITSVTYDCIHFDIERRSNDNVIRVSMYLRARVPWRKLRSLM